MTTRRLLRFPTKVFLCNQGFELNELSLVIFEEHSFLISFYLNLCTFILKKTLITICRLIARFHFLICFSEIYISLYLNSHYNMAILQKNIQKNIQNLHVKMLLVHLPLMIMQFKIDVMHVLQPNSQMNLTVKLQSMQNLIRLTTLICIILMKHGNISQLTISKNV